MTDSTDQARPTRGDRGVRRRRPRVWQVVVIAIAALLVAEKAIALTNPTPQVGRWRSIEGFESYRTAYSQVMERLPPATRVHDVRTAYGTVRVYEWSAPGDHTPVVFLPGIRSGAPMWVDNIRPWLGRRTVYALDAVGDAGMSTQSTPLTSFDDHATWLDQTFAGLGLDRIHLVGHSFGGAMAATYATHHPERLATLTMFEPVMVVQALPASTYLWATLLMLPVPQAWRDKALAEIGGVTVAEVQQRDPVSVMIEQASAHYVGDQLTPRPLTDQEWRTVLGASGEGVPTRIDIAADTSLTGGEEAAARSRRLGMDRVTVWPGATHSLPMQVADQLEPELARWWADHDA
ncbi:alpha/beta fold hydrolase [Propionibacteriaceae bacterium Y2011]